jgi:radical SAM superfamily enzyme YgiQ (UPF0313 family)
MKVVLINPHTPRAEVTEYLGITVPPMGLAYLAAVLEREGYPVKIIDAQALRLNSSELRAQLEKERPDIIGATAVTPTIYDAMNAIKIGKKACPEAFTILGGPHATFLPIRTLRECSQLDAVCIGEGEETMLDLTRALERNGNLANVRGIAYRKGKKVAKNLPRPLISDLDSLPFPARHLLPMDKYTVLGNPYRTAVLLSSRGCPFNCVFCSSSRIFGKKFRARSAKNTVDEMEHIVEKYKIHQMEFADDTFTLIKKRVEDICYEIVKRGLDVTWACSSRADTVTKDLLIKMRKAGCSLIFYGIESASQRVLNLMNKGEKLRQIVKAIRWTKEAGIEAYGSFILGFPGESRAELEATIKFAKKIGIDFAEFSTITAFPGSPLYETAKKENALLTEDWSQYTGGKPNVVNPEIPPRQLAKYLARAYISFYTWPRVVFHHLLKGRFRFIKTIALDILRKSRLPLW